MAVSPLALLLLLLAFAVSLLYILRRPAPLRSGSDGGRRHPPPSPRGLPLLGHLHLLGSLPHRALRSLAAAHGPVLLLRLGRVPAVVVSSPAAAEEVMKARDLAFASRPRSAMADRLLYGRDVAFAPYGEYWRQARRVCVVHLLSPLRILSFRGVREEEAAALVERVRGAGAGGAVVDLCELLVAYANTVVSRAAFGDDSARGLYEEGNKGRELRKVFNDFQELLGTAPVGELLPWLGWLDAVRGMEGKIRRTFKALDGVLEKVIDDHRRRRQAGQQTGDDGGDHRDFVDVLLDVNETDNDAGHVRGGHGHHKHGNGVGHGGAHHESGQHAQAPGRDQGGRRWLRARHHRGPPPQAALPQGRGKGDATPAPTDPAPRAPRAAKRRRDTRPPRPGGHAGRHQRVGRRPGPGGVGARRGVRA
uniref:Cytochrome P450 71A1 n=1 Tax=Aegilops tauschii subsp. strangulata TaxID=200361 RepID=A0A453EHP3_AEGTS